MSSPANSAIVITGAPPRETAPGLAELMGSDAWRDYASPHGGPGGAADMPSPRGGDVSQATPAAGPAVSPTPPPASPEAAPTAGLAQLVGLAGGNGPIARSGPGPGPGPVTVMFASASYTVMEGHPGAMIAVTLSAPSSSAVTVGYRSLGGTATPGADYTPVDSTVTFAPGSTYTSFFVPIVNDTLPEPDETVGLELYNPVGATLGSPAAATLTIQDDDGGGPPPGGVGVLFAAASYSADEPDGQAVITVRLTGASAQTVTVGYATSNGSATDPDDYYSASGTLTFAPGETEQTFTVNLVDDLDMEPVETVGLSLSNPTNAMLGTPSTATLSIEDDDPDNHPPYAAPDEYGVELNQTLVVSADEGVLGNDLDLDGDPLTAALVTGPTKGTLSLGADGGFTYTHTDGTAGLDTFTYRASDGQAWSEPATVTIGVGQVVTLIPDDGWAAENPLDVSVFTVRRYGPLDAGLTVGYTVGSSSTATAGVDYVGLSGTVGLLPGENTAQIIVEPIDDALQEGDETVVAQLAPSSAYALYGTTSGVATIQDDETPWVTVEATDPSADEGGDEGTYTVRRDGSTATSLQVYYTLGGTATNGVDYLTLASAVTVPAGMSEVVIEVGPLTDQLNEGDEEALLTLEPHPTYFVGTTNAAIVTLRETAQVRLVADTDRDGDVDSDDDEGRNKWTTNLGAIYAVNLDDDNNNGVQDAVRFMDNGAIESTNNQIENNEDVKDIAPLVVGQTGVAPQAGDKWYLRAANLDDARAIHVFPSRTSGATAILGGRTAMTSKVEITSLVKQNEDVTFGVEGLMFRNDGKVVAANQKFDGYIDLYLDFERGGKTKTDHVRMKVAPWIALSHDQASQEVWATERADNKRFLRTADADPDYHGISDSGQLQVVPHRGRNQVTYFQDQLEFGYTERPGGPKIEAVFQLPYTKLTRQPTWVLSELLGKNVGVFQLGLDLEAGSGDYGGNLEVMPPTAGRKLGQLIVGDTRSARLMQFLVSQEVQPVVTLPTRWLTVGHVDEAFGFGYRSAVGSKIQVFVADPEDALTRLNAIPADQRGKATFFAKGATDVGTVTAASAMNPDNRIETGMDLSGKTAADWKYIRIYSGAAAGQIARISKWEDDYLEVDKVWNTTSKLVSSPDAMGNPTPSIATYAAHDRAFAPTQNKWYVKPALGDKFVLIQDSTEWWNGTPAAVTVHEVLGDLAFANVNLLAKAQIASIKSTLLERAGGAGALTFVPMPVLYFGRPQGAPLFNNNRSAFAFGPNLANFQPLADNYYFARQFAPKDAMGKDIFEAAAAAPVLADGRTAVFVEDWGPYHQGQGNVHCGTVVRRELLTIDWWGD